jgi:hypothetical protein
MPRAYCSVCLAMRQCRETPDGPRHAHRKPTQWFGPVYYAAVAYMNEQTYRIELGLDDMDLITLPTGGHVPVPIATRLIGKEAVEGIPMDRQKLRDEKFFHCPECFGDGLSFYRCKVHRQVSDVEYNHAKDALLLELAATGKLKRCRYVRAKTRPLFDRRDRF